MVFILRCPGHSLAMGTLLVEYQIHIIPPLTSDPCAHIPFHGWNPGRQLLRPTGPRILSVLHYFRSPVTTSAPRSPASEPRTRGFVRIGIARPEGLRAHFLVGTGEGLGARPELGVGRVAESWNSTYTVRRAKKSKSGQEGKKKSETERMMMSGNPQQR